MMQNIFIFQIHKYVYRRNTSGNNRNTPTMAPQSFVKMEMPVDFDSNQQYIVYTD